jgi:O-antigen polymerase
LAIKIILLILLLGIGVSLINADTFGDPSLFSYFFYSIMVSVLGIGALFFGGLSFRFKITLPVLFFLLLSLYIFLHGVVNGSLWLTHYYWLINATLLLVANSWTVRIDSKQLLPLLLKGILLFALIESVVVIMQAVNILPVVNKYFSVTGTWINPNVTAMFLAMGLFSINSDNYLGITKTKYSKILPVIVLLIIISAIVLLRCRSAYIITLIFLLMYSWQYVKKHLSQFTKLNTKYLFAFFVTIILFISIPLSFYFKQASTTGRLLIWKNCLQLIATKPLTGFGFGQFEKEYNLFVANNNLPSNDHVFMPYNDFLELAVEGGLVAVVLWSSFLVSLLYSFRKNKPAILIVLCFIIIQLTNFGFQAIPVFALFLLYGGCLPINYSLTSNKNMPPKKLTIIPISIVSYTFLIGQLLLLYKLFSIARDFKQSTIISEQYTPQQATEEYELLSNTLHFSSSYHEKYADAFFKNNNYAAAKNQLLQALQTSSNPNVLGKIGWCYGKQQQYDSAAYYFKIIEKLQPYKFAPRMAMLQLYQQQKDTIMIKQKAQELINMPVKIPSAEVSKMKEYANKIMNDIKIAN